MKLQGKKIVLGITGGIAAYKAIVLLRMFKREGAEVQVVMTPSAKEFVTPLTLATLSERPVVSEFFDRRDGSWHSHVSIGEWADLMVIAPLTASTLGKMAHGVADNMLVTTYLSMKAPVMTAPAMDLDMYAHPTTLENLTKVQSHGVQIVEAESGFLASGLIGKGRMVEPECIFEQVVRHFQRVDAPDIYDSLQGKRVVITAGPTYEAIDQVRFIGNRSSGLMGVSIANSFCRMGADVHLILGPSSLKPIEGVTVYPVQSADEMFDQTNQLIESCDVAVFSAAVADFKPAHKIEGKVKRSTKEGVDFNTIELAQNRDIAAMMGQQKRSNQFFVGFALEISVNLDEAKRKMTVKGMDAIVLNSLSDKGAGFNSVTNKIMIIDRGEVTDLPLAAKAELADYIIAYVAKQIQ